MEKKRRTLTVNSPISSRVRIVHSRLSSSASGIIVSHCPEISKSCHSFSQSINTPSHPTHRLRELAHATLGHDRVVSPIHLPDLPQLRLSVRRAAHGEVTREGYGMVVSQRELLAALVLKVEYKLRVLAVLASKYVLPLEYRRIELRAAVQHEALLDDTLDVLATEHLAGTIIARALVQSFINRWMQSCECAYLGRFEQQTLFFLRVLPARLERCKL